MIVGARAGTTQSMEVEPLGDNAYRIRFFPGLVEGIAAGDVIKITEPERGGFEIVSGGGNVAVKLAGPDPLAWALPALTAAFEAVGGRLDGAVERTAVWTIPATAGSAPIEAIMADAVARLPGSEWWYGNVFDETGAPLRWWETRPAT